MIQVLSPPHQEQPGAHRRPRRRQDRHRRGARAPDRRRRRARGPEGQAAGRRSTSARWSPAPSTAASSRSGSRPSSRRSPRPRGRSSSSSTSCTRWSARAKAEGAMDAGNMLKPALARGELHCIGATTLDEYRKHIEKDAALERRFQPVMVGEPSVQDTISILRGLKERYEVHHGVRIQDSALVAAATLSQPLHRRPVPPRQGHRPGRRGGEPAAHRDRLDAHGDRRRPPAHHAAGDRARGPEEGDRRQLPGAAAADREGARRAQRAVQPAQGPLGGGEGGDPEDPRHQGEESRRPGPIRPPPSAKAT